MTAAQTLEIVHGLAENLRQVMSGERILFCLSRTLCQICISQDGQASTDSIQKSLGMFFSAES